MNYVSTYDDLGGVVKAAAAALYDALNSVTERRQGVRAWRGLI